MTVIDTRLTGRRLSRGLKFESLVKSVTSSSAPVGAATVTRTGNHGAGGTGQPEPGLPVARARFTADGRRLELLVAVNTRARAGQPGAAALAAACSLQAQ
jgi:hypothetical protein